MKLDFKMEGEKPSIISVPANVEQPTKRGWSTPKKVTIGVILGLVSLVVVAAVVIVAVHFGSKITRDNFTSARQSFKTDEGQITEEETTVSENDVNIKVPNEVEVVYDYENGLVVERYIDQETRKKSACYARAMNASEAPSRDSGDYEENSEVSLMKSPTGGNEEHWVTTTKRVPGYMVSDTVYKMCRDTEIYWMERQADSGIQKRALQYATSYVHWCYKISGYPCLYSCRVTYYFTDSTTPGIVYYTTITKAYCDTSCASLYAYCK